MQLLASDSEAHDQDKAECEISYDGKENPIWFDFSGSGTLLMYRFFHVAVSSLYTKRCLGQPDLIITGSMILSLCLKFGFDRQLASFFLFFLRDQEHLVRAVIRLLLLTLLILCL